MSSVVQETRNMVTVITEEFCSFLSLKRAPSPTFSAMLTLHFPCQNSIEHQRLEGQLVQALTYLGAQKSAHSKASTTDRRYQYGEQIVVIKTHFYQKTHSFTVELSLA